MYMDSVDLLGRCGHYVTWKSKPRDKVCVGVSPAMCLTLGKFMVDRKWYGPFCITGYTSFKTKFHYLEDAPFSMPIHIILVVHGMIRAW